jgi:hypothetical protein
MQAMLAAAWLALCQRLAVQSRGVDALQVNRTRVHLCMLSQRLLMGRPGKYLTGHNYFAHLNVCAARFAKALKYYMYWHNVLQPSTSLFIFEQTN